MNPTHTTAWNPPDRSVVNRLSGQTYSMGPADLVLSSQEQLINIASICNQPSIYTKLFAERLQGQPYKISDAQDFLNWAKQGWKEQTHFVFFLVASTGLVAGAVDIKSPNRQMAEIGYWCSENHRGLMSNAITELKLMASDARFVTLFAKVNKDNVASIKVLVHSGFSLQSQRFDDPIHDCYEVALSR